MAVAHAIDDSTRLHVSAEKEIPPKFCITLRLSIFTWQTLGTPDFYISFRPKMDSSRITQVVQPTSSTFFCIHKLLNTQTSVPVPTNVLAACLPVAAHCLYAGAPCSSTTFVCRVLLTVPVKSPVRCAPHRRHIIAAACTRTRAPSYMLFRDINSHLPKPKPSVLLPEAASAMAPTGAAAVSNSS